MEQERTIIDQMNIATANVEETSERQSGVHLYFSEHIDTTLKWIELQDHSKSHSILAETQSVFLTL